jgi:hypothetical protein
VTGISFFDHVRISSTHLTEKLGLANPIGKVYGETTPSVTEVEVIGDSTADFAIKVFFAERNEELWFSLDLVEFVDHAPGTEINQSGGQRWVRSASGSWEKRNDPAGIDSPSTLLPLRLIRKLPGTTL